ncbi:MULTISPECIES: ATP-binding cassette domain-containing protein [unclassified Paenibacillus]|uniref:ATP-binding cassette domain-containing protein n=1 Tax=unclassified Paenibacillus TaxID=185978 RepID=UPI002405A3AE|nr:MULTISPECIES: ATP-binding cassette domain-containing protein [unclassified Paenibacillus]MDF9839982.1 energy-coupling factor transporter ATP-binding protein EcfA2/energy-coupling factor transporter transmembrane protein EcfT [Paenibacillus sp. PastF-2]MDF9846564.1 energy-coupling factor transporter ATP-binding protein EcfA2/energy-coupling factor transporter transmembrane protein EcfT [Paenibacillus sp. PastM-2]MDF9853088.1 energy-coupling factor transporter ATP-binding protein EcfA2/energy-c
MSIRAEKVAYLYDSTAALQDVNLEISRGTLAVLCGVTGSGKSTLLRLLAGLDTPSSGRIVYAGGSGGTPKVSIVFQQPETQLFAGSVHKEMEYGLEQHGVPKAQRLELIRSALSRAGLPYDIFAGRSPFLLSGGEKRRLCIAAALAVQPELLILDEPTAGLDPQSAHSLLQLVQQLRAEGITLIIGTHELDTLLPLADQAVVMHRGTVHYNGPAAPLAADHQLLRSAGLEPPAYSRIGDRLRRQGLLAEQPASIGELLARLASLPLPAPSAAGVTGEGMAQPHMSGGGADGGTAESHLPGGGAGGDLAESHMPIGTADGGTAETHSRKASRRIRWQKLDPRVKWLGMLLGSLVVLSMGSFPPVLPASLIICGLIGSAAVPWSRTVRYFRPFLLMFLFLWLLSALDWTSPDFSIGPAGFSVEGMARGGLNVLRFLLLIALGFLFTETTTGAPLREALEWGLTPLKKLGLRTRGWSLAVSVTLQFVPWILGKLDQLQLALKSRGKPRQGLARWTPRQIAMLIVPLLILVISMGDELATAVESRGYDPKKARTPAYSLNWKSADTLALACVVLTTALLWWFSLIS